MKVTQRLNMGDTVILKVGRSHVVPVGSTGIIHGSYAEVCNSHHHHDNTRNLQIYSVIWELPSGSGWSNVAWFGDAELRLIRHRRLSDVKRVEHYLRYGEMPR